MQALQHLQEGMLMASWEPCLKRPSTGALDVPLTASLARMR